MAVVGSLDDVMSELTFIATQSLFPGTGTIGIDGNQPEVMLAIARIGFVDIPTVSMRQTDIATRIGASQTKNGFRC